MSERGLIIMRDHNDPYGGIERIDYSWSGNHYTYIDLNLLNDHKDIPAIGEIVQIGPFRLKVIDFDFVGWGITAVRITSPLDYVRYAWHRTNKTLDLIYRRLIITAAIWGCARYSSAMIPSWRNLYIVERFKRLLNR